MQRIHTALLSTFLLCGVAVADGAHDKQEIKPEPPPRTEEVVTATQLRATMNEKIQARFATQEAEMAPIQAELAELSNGLSRMDLQRQLQDIRLQTWRDILDIQLEYATLAGATEHAEHLAERIARLDEGISKPATRLPSRRDQVEDTENGGDAR